MHVFVPLAFLCSLQLSSKYEYVFGLSATNCVIIFPPNSSLKSPGTFLFFLIGRGILSFLLKLEVSNHFSASLEISSKKSSVLI